MEKEEKEFKEVKEVKEREDRIVNGSANIVWLSEIGKKDIAIAGGKGANLAEIYNLEMPVPPAFVVTAQAFARFLKETNIGKKIYEILKTIELENTQELEKKAKQVRQIIIDARMPDEIRDDIADAYDNLNVDKEMLEHASKDALGILKVAQEPCFVAVRSSATTEDLATASFAGQQDTYLNIKGTKHVLDAVKRCWASLFTARAVYYREKKGFEHEKSLIAIIVQRMINSDKSGVIFTINPVTNDKSEIVIEAVYGLGEGIVSGAIEPDNYIINKENFKLKKRKLGKKNIYFTRSSSGETIKLNTPNDRVLEQVLQWPELEKLAIYAKELEEHYKWPQDIEYAIERNNVYIVQTRPVTTTEKKEKERTEEIQGQLVLEGLAASQGVASGTVKVIHNLDELYKVKQGDVLVTKMTNPDMVVTMQKSKAIVTDEGGSTAHAAIVSREIGIPCVVGTRKATEILKDGQIVTVDGTHGKVYLGRKEIKEEKTELEEKPGEKKIEKGEPFTIETAKEEKPVIAFIGQEIKKAWNELKDIEKDIEHIIVKKHDPIKVKVNCDIPEIAERAAATGADGVGLVRIEFIIAKGAVHPSEFIKQSKSQEYTDMLVQGIEKIAKAFKDKPVWVRTSDLRTDEYTSLRGADKEPKESNPMLGWHGIRRGLDEPEILKAEFKAIKILHEKGYLNVGIMLPFLIYANELKKAKELMQSIGLNPKQVVLGVMIETPASCGIIKELCEQGIQFISFGTNDLTQLTLGIDRNNENLAPLYDEMHPAMLKEIEEVINVCKHYDVQTSICGQAGSKPEMVSFLASKGITSISANVDSVAKVREIVKKYE